MYMNLTQEYGPNSDEPDPEEAMWGAIHLLAIRVSLKTEGVIDEHTLFEWRMGSRNFGIMGLSFPNDEWFQPAVNIAQSPWLLLPDGINLTW